LYNQRHALYYYRLVAITMTKNMGIETDCFFNFLPLWERITSIFWLHYSLL